MHGSRRPHLVVLGGFLGAGKTTAMRQLATLAMEMGIRVGVITNDQGEDLVDTRIMRNCGFDTREVTGGCFCCRFDALLDAATPLTSDVGPELFFAEAVGSCTDLVATVTTPMRQLFGERFTVGPLSVLVDPMRVRSVLGMASSERYSDDVSYIYRKQLEEAELIVITKSDALPDDAINEVGSTLAAAFPRAEVIAVSARDGLHMREWSQRVLFGTAPASQGLDIDYERYAEGEARLGWLNASLQLRAEAPIDANAFLMEFAIALQARLRTVGATVAHLKLSFEPEDASSTSIATVHVARDDAPPEAALLLSHPTRAGTLLLNVRAETSPALLERSVRETAEGPHSDGFPTLTIVRLDSFAPGRPQPTHRLAAG